MTTIFYSPRYGPRPRRGEGVYAASRLAELQAVFDEEGSLILHELRRHEVTEPIPEFRVYGWSPHLDFEHAGFNLERLIDLTTIQPDVYIQRFAGSPEILQKGREKIKEVINGLNIGNTEFVFFRTYCAWPKKGDNVYFYSVSHFKDEPFRMPIR